MAKRKKKSGAGHEGTAESAAKGSEAAAGGRAGVALMIVVLGLVLAAGAFVTSHRRKDPARIWARNVEAAHAQKIERRFAHCFGGRGDADAIRLVVADARQGRWSASFHTCAGPRFGEVIAAPLDFLVDVVSPPGPAESAQARERGRLERLRGALQTVERATSDLDRSQPVPDAARDRVATALEDLAIETQNEYQSMEDLANAAESSASWW
jgi:hypothetical protein